MFNIIINSILKLMQKKGRVKEKILVFSLDDSGCAEHIFSRPSGEINKKHPLLNKIIKKIKREKPQKVVLMVGSTRQDELSDINNELNNGSGSCFVNYANLATHLQQACPGVSIKFDRLLMVDVSYNQKPGKAIKNALGFRLLARNENNPYIKDSNRKNNQKYWQFMQKKKDVPSNSNRQRYTALLKRFKGLQDQKNNEWLWDEYKITIILAQIYYLSHKYPSQEIDYAFFDDRCCLLFEEENDDEKDRDIVVRLYNFFQDNHELIPANIDL